MMGLLLPGHRPAGRAPDTHSLPCARARPLNRPSATGTTLNLGASTTPYNFRKPHQRLRITKNRTLYRKRRKNRCPACLALFSVFLHYVAENTVPRSVVWPGEGSGGCRAWSPKRRIVAWQGLDGYGGEWWPMKMVAGLLVLSAPTRSVACSYARTRAR